VPAVFGSLFREGWRIKFAHRTFSWDSEAPGKATVHCVNVGFSRGEFKPLADIPMVTYGSKAVDDGDLIRPGASWALHSTVLCLIGRWRSASSLRQRLSLRRPATPPLALSIVLWLITQR